MNLRLLVTVLCSLFLFACSDPNKQATADYGPAQPRDRLVEQQTPLAKQYIEEVKPILENRCVVCHACYDAPCQLKLSSPEGIDRGFSPELVYGTRFHEAPPTRLFIDAQKTQQWRDKGYGNVLNERDQTPTANLDQSVLFQLLALKESHPQPTTDTLSDDDFDFSLTREQTCPDMNNIEDYKKDQPLAGMPYGLPNLDSNEFNTLKKWIEQGAPMAQPASLSASIEQQVMKWEAVFNQQDNKSKLINRYIYEHLFLGHLYFSDHKGSEQPVYFRLVRSVTPPGKPIQEIASRRPYEDPKVARFYYRLRVDNATIVNKTHMPYALNEQRLARWNELFYHAQFNVDSLPGYKHGSNPFRNFAAIPPEARYQFMLDEAEFTIMGFIKGPVCRGQTALNVIQDKFWVVFNHPNNLKSEAYNNFIFEQADNLALPSDYSATHYATTSWLKYAKRERGYINAQKQILSQSPELGKYVGFNSLWEDKGNDNDSLTIFRHFDSAVVVRGLQGQPPKTAWVINYPILERIHYLLVAGFDVFGSIRHQLVTRLYMDFLRIESEMSFIALLPKDIRREKVESWYQDSTKDLKNYLTDGHFYFKQENSVTYQSEDATSELFSKLTARYKTAPEYNLNIDDDILKGLNRLPNMAVKQLAQVSFIMVENEQGESQLYTLLRHNERSNIATLLKEKKTRLPDLDTAEVFKGLLSSYPQVIFNISTQQKKVFVKQLQSVSNAQQYAQLLSDFAIRRTHPDFWKISDQLHKTHQQQQPINYGLFDYNRLENR